MVVVFVSFDITVLVDTVDSIVAAVVVKVSSGGAVVGTSKAISA